MDIFRLDPNTLLPTDLVENYSSMVWTERHHEEGEFELRTAKVAETKAFLPEKTLISHLDTDEVMKVETHLIEKDSNGNPELLIKGRALKPSLLENRAMVGYEYNKDWNAYQQYTASEVVAAILWNYLVNDSGNDAFLGSGDLNPAVRVPNLVITDSTNLGDDPRTWFFKSGEVYSQLKELLVAQGLGVRSMRPMGVSGNIISLNTTLESTSRGAIVFTPTSDIPQLRLDVYHGEDRTRGQSTNDPVIFSYEFGDIDDPSYLFSARVLKNMALTVSSLGVQEIWPDTGLIPPTVVPTGADLRILYFDAGEPDEQPPSAPDVIPYPEDATAVQMSRIDAQNAQAQAVYQNALVAYDQLSTNFQDEVVRRAQEELKKFNREIVFDGAISPLSTYRYREQYFLGDRVTLEAEYGVEETMVVSEYVRTEDQTGDRGYPTLVLAE